MVIWCSGFDFGLIQARWRLRQALPPVGGHSHHGSADDPLTQCACLPEQILPLCRVALV
jgi:hypothetical protein